MKIKYEITLFVTHVLTTHVTRVNVTCQWVNGDMSVGHVTSFVRTSHVTHVRSLVLSSAALQDANIWGGYD